MRIAVGIYHFLTDNGDYSELKMNTGAFKHQTSTRKVRFTLPTVSESFGKLNAFSMENALNNNNINNNIDNKLREHGTKNYINGTLVPVKKPPNNQNRGILFRPQSFEITKVIRHVPGNIQQIVPRIQPAMQCLRNYSNNSDVIKYGSERGTTRYRTIINNMNNSNSNNNKKINNSSLIIKIPSIKKFASKSTNTSSDHENERLKELRYTHMVNLKDPPPPLPTLVKISSKYKLEDSPLRKNHVKQYHLIEDILKKKRKFLKLNIQYGNTLPPKPPPVEANIEQKQQQNGSDTIARDKLAKITTREEIFSEDQNTALLADLIQRWNRVRYREEGKFQNEMNETTERTDPLETVSFGNRLTTNVRRFGCLKMNFDREPPLTSLLRAARDIDEISLKVILKKILSEGISRGALNATDRSGRTALSYICTTDLTYILNMFLKIPGIDVNKADNEGNTPLHFAAQAGQVNILMTLLNNSPGEIKKDPKNFLGLTPLMKAALQGRTTCAKLLLLAGASPIATDYRREFIPEQWARLTGMHTCADMIHEVQEEVMRTNPKQWREEEKKERTGRDYYAYNPNFIRNFYELSRKIFARSSRKKKVKNDIRPLTGPEKPVRMKVRRKLEFVDMPRIAVSPANNEQLIKKFESRCNRDQSKYSSKSAIRF